MPKKKYPEEAGHKELNPNVMGLHAAVVAQPITDTLEVNYMLYGHEKLYLVVGRNKLADTYDEALWRARNIAAPKNAQRLQTKTPCAVKGDRCYDCKSPDRICRGLAVLWRPMNGMETEVVLIDEDLGY